jgi:hypothetical protein
MLFLPRNVVDTQELAARMAAALPNYSAEEMRTILATRNKVIQQSLINGEQVTEEGNCTYTLSFTARLNNPDDPAPPIEECLQVRVHASPPFTAGVCHSGKLEQLAQDKKLPLINRAKDTLFKLENVLNPNSVLQLTGEDLYFDAEQGTGECVIEGTESGRAVQSRLNLVSNSTIMLMPDIPTQSNPWNNEYTMSVTTRYTPHGTPRTGIYERMLRTPLVIATLEPGQATGILTGAAEVPYVQVVGGTTSGEATLRIQVLLDVPADCLRFNLLDMTEGGAAGAVTTVTANGDITLQGFAGSPVTTLDIRVLEYAALKEMLRNNYNCRLVDVLVVQ